MDDKYIKGIRIDWSEIKQHDYLRKIPVLQPLRELWFSKNVTFFVGENGAGKSTLLEAIAVSYGFNAEGGSRNFNFSTRASHSELGGALTVIKGVRAPRDGYFLRAESFYNVATHVEEYQVSSSYGGSLHNCSHGESFLALVDNRFRGQGLYLLDEPEAALSPQRQLVLLLRLWELAKNGSQFLIATHSPILLGMPNATILSFDGDRLREIAYEETDCYRTMELFINHKTSMLRELLGSGFDEELQRGQRE